VKALMLGTVHKPMLGATFQGGSNGGLPPCSSVTVATATFPFFAVGALTI